MRDGPYRADGGAGAAISDEEMVWCRALAAGGTANVAALLVSRAMSSGCVVSNSDGLMVVAGPSADPMLAAFLARLGVSTTVGDMHVAARAQASSAAPALLAKLKATGPGPGSGSGLPSREREGSGEGQ